MKKARAIAILMMLLMLFSAFVSCDDTPLETDPATSSESSEESVTENASSAVETDSQQTEPSQTETTAEEPTEETQVEEPSVETASETETETEEETVLITDVMTGETIEAEYAADFSVSRVFSDNMVVQRNEHIRVWGFAPESENGKKVSGEFKGMFAEALIENGEWCLTFGARLEADTEAAEMKIYTDKKTVTFSGVLVGDVYMVVGQSNVEYSVNQHIQNTNAATQGGGTDAIDPDSIIRLNKINNSSGGTFDKKGTDYVYKDAQSTKQWTKTTQSDVLGFSALGYYFAKQMVDKADGKVPVGVIEIGFSGAPLGSYLPNEVAEKYNTDTLSAATGKYTTTGVNAAASPGRWIYNCHMAAFEKYAIAGLVWYQGESNNSNDEAVKFNEVFAALMTHMRETHNVVNKNFPVFVVEFPSIYKKPAGFTGTWHFMELGIIRSFMGSIPTVLKNSYVSVSGDLWADKTFFNSLHPNCKYEQAERLASLADTVILGNGTLDNATGPIFESVAISADKKTVVITFTNVGEGLTTKDGGKAVQGIVGFGTKTIGLLNTVAPKSAEITAKDQITVTFAEEVKAVAYNFLSSDLYGETLNLCNSAKCPASAFITPYEEMKLDGFEAKSFLNRSHSSLGLKGLSFDTLTADGSNLFEIGGIEAKLNAAGNKIEIQKGTSKVGCYGWVGFKYPIIVLGYSVDGGNAVLKTSPSAPQEAVIAAGGKNAVRFTINVDVSNLSAGDHTVSLLALVDVKDGAVANLLTFKVTVTEPEETPEDPENPESPEAQTYRPYDASEYGVMGFAFDMLKADSEIIYTDGKVLNKLNADGNTVTVKKGTKQLYLYGWIGYPTTLDKLGYALDGVERVETNPLGGEVHPAVIAAGGENAKRYGVYVDMSGLDVGEHTCDFLVRINTKDRKTATLLIHSFTLIVTE